VQLVAHLGLPSVAHWLLGHAMAVGVLQAPALLQTDAVVTLPVVQLAAVQIVVLSGNVQDLLLVPSHRAWQAPVPPQAARAPVGLPLRALHFPIEPDSLQDSH
jgi:hypothetical protein